MRAARGQSTVELALGALVFVTVLLFGVHFGEVGVAMLKVKEAATFAAFDVAAHRTDGFTAGAIASGTTFSSFNPGPIGQAAKARYRDLDGMSDRSGPGWTQALTQLDRFSLSCERDATLKFQVAPTGGGHRGELSRAMRWLRNRYRDQGGASCRSEAWVSAIRIPTGFAEGPGGLFQAEHRSLIDLPLCGAGFAQSGACPGALAVLTGEWTFDGPLGDPRNGDVPSTEQGVVNNPPYRDLVKQIFDLNGGPLADSSGTPAEHLMKVAAGVRASDPEYLDETAFSMSYQGDVNQPQVTVPTHPLALPAGNRIAYQTSGADLHSAYVGWNEVGGDVSGVPRCFLGLYGCEYPRGALTMLALALGWLCAAAPAPIDPFADLPKVIEVVPVSGELSALETPVLAKAYRVKMTPLETLRWVQAAFRRAQLYIPPPERQFQLQGAPQLTGYDGPHRRSYTAIFKDDGDGTTTLIAGTADLSSGAWEHAGHSLPVMPTARGPVESGDERGRVLAYSVAAKEEEADSFYAEVLPAGGWKRDDGLDGWVRGGQLLTLERHRREDGQLSVTLVVRPVAAR